MLTRRGWIIAALLAIAAAIPYWQTRHFDFVNYDDVGYLVKNPIVHHGLTAEGVAFAFTSLEMANWHPVTWLSYMLDVSLFGNGPRGFHITNVVLHALNSGILYLVLLRMFESRQTWWRAAIVAALFALHPLHVESVAWISERKDLLSVLFGLLAIDAYVGWTRRSSAARYGLIVIFFALSLMSKPMLVTLPFVLLLLDHWPLKRRALARKFSVGLIIEKLPLLAISIASSVMTVIAQGKGGAMQELRHMPLSARLSNAVVSYAQYLADTVWPAGLAVLYPHPGTWPAAVVFVSVVTLIVITVGVIALHKRVPSALVGWLWFLGTLVPVIGIVQVGEQSRADRYTYFPLIGMFLAAAWCLPALNGKPQWRRWAMVTVSIAAMVALCAVTWKQIGYWRSSRTLFERALAVTERNFSAHNNLGLAHVNEGQLQEGFRHFELALQIRPDLADAYSNLGDACLVTNQIDEAISNYIRALQFQPDNATVRTNLAAAYLQQKRFDEAIEQLQHALRLRPKSIDARFNLGAALADSGRIAEAIEQFARVVQMDSTRVDAWKRLAMAQAMMGQGDAAIDSFRRAAALEPRDATAFMNLAALLLQRPGRSAAHVNEAIEMAQRAVDLTQGTSAPAMLLLAQSHAVAGNRQQALQAAERAQKLGQQSGVQSQIHDAQQLIDSLR